MGEADRDGNEPEGPRQNLLAHLRKHQRGCELTGSPFYVGLLQAMIDDVEGGGWWWTRLGPFAAESFDTVRPLRVLGVVHRAVLLGEAPGLAAHYPSRRGDGDAAAAWPLLTAWAQVHPAELDEALARPVQTNEVFRSVALVGGFAEIARRTGLPLALFEVGSSGGLNLRVDGYWYEARNEAGDVVSWGDPTSAVRFEGAYEGAGTVPPLGPHLCIVERRGVDRFPIDASTPDGAATLLGFVWPGHDERFAALRDALDVAARLPVAIDRADAAPWVAERLATVRPCVATVVYHSVVWQYLPDATRDAMVAALHAAGARATPDAPVAWLRLEPQPEDKPPIELLLTLWPGGDTVRLATAGMHRQPVVWEA